MKAMTLLGKSNMPPESAQAVPMPVNLVPMSSGAKKHSQPVPQPATMQEMSQAPHLNWDVAHEPRLVLILLFALSPEQSLK